MKTVRSATAAAIVAAMLATSVTPAMAQGYSGGYGQSGYGKRGDWGRHRHRDRIGAGEVIAGVAILGVIAAIASAGSKRRGANDGYRGIIRDENAAADACAMAAEQRGGQVNAIDDVYRTSDGYSVRGTVSTRGGYNRRDRSFTCEVRYGAVESVRIDDRYDRYDRRGY